MTQREDFTAERERAESYFAECTVIARWIKDGRLVFSDEIEGRNATYHGYEGVIL